MLGDDFVEHTELESPLNPVELYAALKKDADDWHESRMIQYPWGRAFYGFGMRGDGTRFRIRLYPVSGITCTGVVEAMPSGSRLRASLRFSRWLLTGYLIYFGAAACIAIWGNVIERNSYRSTYNPVVEVVTTIIILGIVALLLFAALHFYWTRLAAARTELRRLLIRVAGSSSDAGSSALK